MQRKKCSRLVTFSVIVLLLCSTITVITLRSPQPVHAASVPTGLHVVGNQLEDGGGHVIVPHGVDRMGTEYQCTKSGIGTDFDGPVDQASVNAMLTWDINIVRVPLNEDCWLGINGFPANGFTSARYQTDIENWVSLLNQNGMIVILDLHWNNSGSNQATGQEPMPDLDHAPAFWTSVATTFKSNSSVIFDLYNEPFTNSWSCWVNGSTAASASPCTDVGFAAAGMQTLVNTVRSTGAMNVLMLGGLAFSNDLTSWLANKPSDPANNLVASTHIYNFNACASISCWNSEIAPVKAQVPVLAGEIGENDCASSFINTLTDWLDSESIGYMAWTWTTANCSSTPALISDYTGTPTAFGQGFKAHLLSLGGGNGSTPTPTPTLGVTPTPTSTASAGCKVQYTITNQWPGGFGATIAITNTGSTTINGWTLTFTFPNGQTITQLWNGSFTQSGSAITLTNASYNASIAPGAAVSSSPGFNGSWSGSNPSPTSFKLNNVVCSLS